MRKEHVVVDMVRPGAHRHVARADLVDIDLPVVFEQPCDIRRVDVVRRIETVSLGMLRVEMSVMNNAQHPSRRDGVNQYPFRIPTWRCGQHEPDGVSALAAADIQSVTRRERCRGIDKSAVGISAPELV